MEDKDLYPGASFYYLPDPENEPNRMVAVTILNTAGHCECCGNLVYRMKGLDGTIYRATKLQLRPISCLGIEKQPDKIFTKVVETLNC